jgi:hypothetical protein
VTTREISYDAPSLAQARVQVAEDVLALLEAGKVVPEKGRYVVTLEAPTSENHYGSTGRLSEHRIAELVQAGCGVCAVGACFVSAVLRFDALEFSPYNGMDDPQMRRYLDQWFSREQLGLIETAFEGKVFHPDGDGGDLEDILDDDERDRYSRALDFYGQYMTDSAARLRAIWMNVAINKGTFTP